LLSDPASEETGWIESLGERSPGVASVSAPVFDDSVLIAALCLSGPIDRLAPSPGQRFGKSVVAAAREIEHAVATADVHGRAKRNQTT
jgi:DNA-binding IclR family transcriptional regulator